MSKKFMFVVAAALILLPVFLPGKVQAKTLVSGYHEISVDTVWTKEGSPYVIDYYVRVKSGAKLTIMPGTVIKSYSYGSIYVNGTLEVKGAEDAPVVFTSIFDNSVGGGDSPNPGHLLAAGDWGGIKNESNGILAIDHALMKYGGRSWECSAAVCNFSGQMNVVNSEFTSNIRAFLRVNTWGAVHINNSKIYGNPYGGVVSIYSYGLLDATNNWWGHESGPNYAAYNPSGQGDQIISATYSSKVLFDPWIGKVTNQPPVLAYSRDSGFDADGQGQGVEPDKGAASSTDFVFKMVYTDKDNDPPSKISTVVQKGSSTVAYPMEIDVFAAPELHDGNYANGEQYAVTAVFPQGKYQYYFEAADEKATARQPASSSLVFEAGYSNIVFLPGFEASRLFTRGLLMENQLWEPNRENDVEKLFMDESGTSINPDIYTRETIDEVYNLGAFPNIYKTFLESLDQMVKRKTINQAKALPYDWRMSIDDIVTGVVKTDNDGYAMTKEIEAMASSSQSGKVTIVAHSMGGLVAKRLMIRLAELGQADLVDKLILVASPQAGTPGAVAGLLHGDDQDLAFGLILDKSTAREFGENMASAYSLLPSAAYFENAHGPVIEFDQASALFQGMRTRYGATIASSQGLNDFMLGREGRNEPASADIETPNVLSEPILNGVINLHASLDAWTPPEGLKVIQIAGWDLDTISGIRYKEKWVLECPNDGYFDLLRCVYKPVYDREPIFSENGDKTVMMSSAEMMKGARTYFLDIDSSNVGFRTNRKHKDIMEIDSMQALLNNIVVEQDSLPAFVYKNKEELPAFNKRLRLSVHSPVLLDVYDAAGRHTGIVNNSDPESDLKKVEEAIPNSYYLSFGEGKYVGVGGSDTYQLELKGTGYGTFTLDVAELNNGDETHFVYWNIPVTPLTKTRMSLVSLDKEGTLEIDMNGDGEIDYQIGSPTETIDPLKYIDIMSQSIDSMEMDEQIKKYLMVRLKVIKDKIGKNNEQAIEAQLEVIKNHFAEEIGKTISGENAFLLLTMVGNLDKLMIK